LSPLNPAGDTGPTLTTTPGPSAVTLTAIPPTLKDTATLTGGSSPTGTITFTLYSPSHTLLDTETVPVSGDGSYTPPGFTLPTTGTVAGVYQWDASYSGDGNNATTTDTNDPAEQVTVNKASPTITTRPSPKAVTLGTAAVTLTDTATLTGGYAETGAITFTLLLGSTRVDTETVAVNGDGTYKSRGYTLPSTGTVAGTYQWDAVYSGDGNNNSFADNNTNEQVAVAPAAPVFSSNAEPTSYTLDGAGPPTLKDSFTLAGGYHPTGNIIFTLHSPGGALLDTETVAVSGNGTYTPTGYTLPTSGTVIGVYQWDATYSGDGNNIGGSDTGASSEQTTVLPAKPLLTTTPSPDRLNNPGNGPVTLTDTADLEGGFDPTGTITFTLYDPSGALVCTETATVSGNGTYKTPTGFTLPTEGTVAGTYQWDATYSGDGNNATASDNNDPAEQVPVNKAGPTIFTTPDPDSLDLGTTAPTLTDTADLEGGFDPSGTITFTLYSPGGTLLDTETVEVSGDGSYTTPDGYTLPTTGTVTGTYQWDATYSGDGNNATASDNNDPDEEVFVNPASPTITTTPNTDGITLETEAPTLMRDTADLEGGYAEKGTITFTLYSPANALLDTETVEVSGNGSYTTPNGYTLPTTGTVTGTYQWDATYSGDGNNATAADTNDPAEQVFVGPAGPTISTTPSPTTVTNPDGGVTLMDTAHLEGGYAETGTITFTLFDPNGDPVDTETAKVNGNGTFTTPTGYMLPSMATGTYQWDATYNGDGNNNPASDNNDPAEQVLVLPASPTITTTPTPGSVTLGTDPVTLTDTATLTGGSSPAGTITFTLFDPNGIQVDMETATVSGDGTYTTPTGYTLPTDSTVTGTYQWDASYSGDDNNLPANDNNDGNEQVVVSSAGPTISTTPSPASVSNPASSPVALKDTADLEGGYAETGTITFTLFDPNGDQVDMEAVPVDGDGTYTTPNGYTLPATAAGVYQWDATYNGDGNNNSTSDTNDPAEQVPVGSASPTLSTTPNSTTVTLGPTTPSLTDTADLEGGFNPTGTITFTLHNPRGALVDTEKVTVNGNGTYTTPNGFTLPTSGTVVGTYQWVATYAGDGNNAPASDSFSESGDPAEQVTVTKAGPTIATTPGPTFVSLDPTAPTLTDSATLSGGYAETGIITFTLYSPTNALLDTEKVGVNGDGTYTTPDGYTLPTTGTVTGIYRWHAAYSGDGNNATANDTNNSESNNGGERVRVFRANPAITTTPNPGSVRLSAMVPTLTDTADLEGGYAETGTITFTLLLGSTRVDTETVGVNGDGTYTTPNGYNLPSTGTVIGTYQWVATYSGDGNNNPASDSFSDSSDPAEQVTVNKASPVFSTNAEPTSYTLDAAGSPTLKDSFALAGGFHPTGSITFTLFSPGRTLLDTEKVGVNGDGTYTTPNGYTLPTNTTVIGTYQWVASYSGDSNNIPRVSSAETPVGPPEAATSEQTAVLPARPLLTTTPSPGSVNNLGTSPVILTDTADLEGGDAETGTITFTLFDPSSTLVDSETVRVNGDGIYTTPAGFTPPTTVAGTYQWYASYSGDGNNAMAGEADSTNERVPVGPASPTITTQPSPATVVLGSSVPTLEDTATLSGGSFPTGTITFRLFLGSSLLDTETVPVTGDGTYTMLTGYTLAPSDTVPGVYQWDATYSGDDNNQPASDNNNAGERVAVFLASPSSNTDPGPGPVPVTPSPVIPTPVPVQPPPPAPAPLPLAPQQPQVLPVPVLLLVDSVATVFPTATFVLSFPPLGGPPTPRLLRPLGGSDRVQPPELLSSFADLMGVDIEIEPTLRPPVKPIKNVASLLDADDNVGLAEMILAGRRPPAAPGEVNLPGPAAMPPEEQEAGAAPVAVEVTLVTDPAPPESRGLWTAALWLTGLGMAAGAGIGLLWWRRRVE
jgi:hypothetical protein